MSSPEAKVKNRIRRILKNNKVYFFMPATHGFGRSGVPDFVCCHRGVFLGIEAKAGGNKPTKLQQKELDAILLAGGWAMVVNEETVEHLDGFLKQIDEHANIRRARFNEVHDTLTDQAMKGVEAMQKRGAGKVNGSDPNNSK